MKPVKLISRTKVADLLSINREETYDLFPAEHSVGAMIPEGAVLRYLNENRVGSPDELTSLPRLETDADVAKAGVVLVDGKPASLHYIRGLCRRKRNPPPHFRISKRRVRFYPGAVEWWASLINSGVYLDWRVYHYGATPHAPRATR